MKTILFVCTGNTCRSPLAEAVARHWLDSLPEGHCEDVFVASAGVWASDGTPATQETIAALRHINIDYDGKSTLLSAEMVRKANVVLCMTAEHVQAVKELVADDDDDDTRTTIAPLDPDADISDPIGQGLPAYNALVKQFQKLIPRRLKETLFNEDSAGIRSSR